MGIKGERHSGAAFKRVCWALVQSVGGKCLPSPTCLQRVESVGSLAGQKLGNAYRIGVGLVLNLGVLNIAGNSSFKAALESCVGG